MKSFTVFLLIYILGIGSEALGSVSTSRLTQTDPHTATEAPAKSISKSKKKKTTSEAPDSPADTSKKKNIYKDLVAKAAKDEGLFTVYCLDEKYYFEIPDSLFGREMLMVTRYAKTAMDIGFGGESLDERVFFWEKRNDKFVHLRTNSYRKVADKESALYEAVRSSMLPPIVAALEIEGFSADSASVVVNVTDLFRKDALAFGLDHDVKKRYSIGSVEDKSSYVIKIESFPTNVEVRSAKTYLLSGESEKIEDEGLRVVTLEIHNSMLSLPEKSMMPRYYDERVGFFRQAQYDYGMDDAQKATRTEYVRRWRLEPSDKEAYRRGELVEPIKPIVYYLSPTIPAQWLPYFVQGVEDWQAAFERAGFKNAITAKPFPTREENPDFNPFDARYTVIEYFASYVENAYGPHVADPRSGEIVNTHVCICHNALKLLHDWYMVQCGAVDPRARSMVFDEDLMGRLIRYLICHEVGHSLGLGHNFAASHAYPVDSLRSAAFTRENGISASIMDYARFNYVAQPEDKDVYLFPLVGEYDKYAIEWGYRYLPDAKSPEDERQPLNEFVKSKAGDPRYLYVRQFLIQNDPRAQTEDLGDNAMRSAAYGLKNLRIVMDSLGRWAVREGHDNQDLKEMYGKALNQWVRYMRHVASNIGGTYETYKTADQEGPVYEIVPKEIKKEALDFLCEHAFTTPLWMVNQPYITKFSTLTNNNRRFVEQQCNFVGSVLNLGVLLRMNDEHVADPERGYDPMEYLADVRKGIWADVYGRAAADFHRRPVERAYLNQCQMLLEWDVSKRKFELGVLDFKTQIRLDIQQLQKDLNAKLRTTADPLTKQHYRDCVRQIELMLHPELRPAVTALEK